MDDQSDNFNESRRTHPLSRPISCSKTLIMISFLSVKYYLIEAGPNKSICIGSHLSVYFTFLLVKCKMRRRNANLINAINQSTMHFFFMTSSVAIAIR